MSSILIRQSLQRHHIVLATILITSSILNLCIITEGHNWGDDFAVYLMQAESLVNGKINDVIANNKFTIENSSFPIGPVVYTWGYPIILSLPLQLFGANILAMKLMNIIFYQCSLIILYAMFRRRLPLNMIHLLIAILAFHPYFLVSNNAVGSDIPFLFFCLIALALIDWIYIRKNLIFNRFIGDILIGTIIAAASLIRSHGFLLIPVLFITQVIEGTREHKRNSGRSQPFNLGTCVPYLVATFGILFVNGIYPGSDTSQFKYIKNVDFEQLVSNIMYYAKLPKCIFGDPYAKRYNGYLDSYGGIGLVLMNFGYISSRVL